MTIPSELEKGESVTFAVNRLLLADARGEIEEEDFLKLLERLEPAVWRLAECRRKAEPEASGLPEPGGET